jgi:hypothetical protein
MPEQIDAQQLAQQLVEKARAEGASTGANQPRRTRPRR